MSVLWRYFFDSFRRFIDERKSRFCLISYVPQTRSSLNGSGLVVASARSSLGSMAGKSYRRLKR